MYAVMQGLLMCNLVFLFNCASNFNDKWFCIESVVVLNPKVIFCNRITFNSLYLKKAILYGFYMHDNL